MKVETYETPKTIHSKRKLERSYNINSNLPKNNNYCLKSAFTEMSSELNTATLL